jgi:radical SAM protein with 4Fe4S-binding SPASM domain
MVNMKDAKARPVVNSGFNEVLGTDRYHDCNSVYGKGYLEYRKGWKEYPEKAIVSDFPLHVDIESTNACNLRCTMCMRNFMTEDIGYMDWELFKRIIDEGARHGLPSIKLNYRGEPLMHPRIVDMVRYAKEKGVMDVQFNTNGLLLTGDLARKLIEAGLDRIIFSFDGATKETYEKIRTGSDFERVVGNIRRFVEIRDSMGSKKPCVRVQMVKMDENEHEIERFIDMWVPVANRVAVSTKREPGGTEREVVHFPCPQLWQRIMVCWDGEVRVCCGDWGGKIAMGNIKDSGIADIWKSERYSKLRKMHQDRRYGEIPACAKCEVNTMRRDEGLRSIIEGYRYKG